MFKKILFRISVSSILLCLMLTLFTGCESSKSDPTGPIIHERGDIKRSNSSISITPEILTQFMVDNGVEFPFTPSYTVEAVSVEYYTVDATGNIILVSGAIMVPQGASDLPLASVQHGTETKRDLVASVSYLNSVEGVIGLAMASLGYLVVIPDYPGFGVSNVMHPYMHTASLVPSVIDFLRAGRTYCSENGVGLDDRLFLSGYSEGGFVTLLAQKEIEENYSTEFNLTAVAPMAGPYDLTGMMELIFQTDNYSTPAYIGYFFTAYNEIYNWNRLDEIFAAPYAALMPSLYNGSQTWGQIVNQLPATFGELMEPDFVEGYADGEEQEFITAVQENTILNWLPQTPIHFFHGDADQIVPIQNVYTAMNSFNALGATDIQLTVIPGGTHASAGPEAVIGAIEWFEGF